MIKPHRKKLYVVLFLLLVGVGLSVAFIHWMSTFDGLRFRIQYLGRAGANELATELRESPDGIAAALDDFSTSGGSTRWYSSLMLLTSSLKTNVESALQIIASNTSEPITRRVEAQRILWLRTGHHDELVRLFAICQPAGHASIGRGRWCLAGCFNDLELQRLFLASHDVELPFTIDKFKDLLQQTNILSVWTKPSTGPIR